MSDITVAKNGQATLTCEMPDDSYGGEWIQVLHLYQYQQYNNENVNTDKQLRLVQ